MAIAYSQRLKLLITRNQRYFLSLFFEKLDLLGNLFGAVDCRINRTV
jgi:hypothetical protein